jgi:hypothetical protein
VYLVKYFEGYLLSWAGNYHNKDRPSALRWLINFRCPGGQVARWTEILAEYNYEIVHRAGRLHSNADGLSRRPCTQCGWQGSELGSSSSRVGSPPAGEGGGATASMVDIGTQADQITQAGAEEEIKKRKIRLVGA